MTADRTERRGRHGGRRRNWGGRRPGAGAPKGTLNALKHGRRSAQLLAIAEVLANDPLFAALYPIFHRAAGRSAQRLPGPTIKQKLATQIRKGHEKKRCY